MCKYTLFLAFIYILKWIQMYNMMPVTQDIFEKKQNCDHELGFLFRNLSKISIQ